MLLDTLLQPLREFFVDVTDANVTFHLGDLFDPSHFRLRDVFLKTELINALHLPFDLKAGYIGDVKVEGVLGFVAGSPLTIGVDNVCLVLAHKPVDWNNELALRYARELLLAILQSVAVFPMGAANKQKAASEGTPAPAVTTSESSSFSLSPAKWILNKVLTTIAETTLKLERLHIRFESDHEGQLIAYGAHIPTVQLSTSDLDDPVLRRREQPGVTYPADSSDHHTACKRLYLANVAFYCDLHATSYLGPSSPKPVVVTTPRGSASGLPSLASGPTLTLAERLAFMRQQCLAPLTPSADRDLVLISALWLKLDFVRGVDTKPTSPSAWGLGAVDLVTEEIKVNVDFTQLAALNDELARVADFVQREQRRAWRPSSVDRDRVAPLQVTLSPSALLPVLTHEIPKPPRSLSRAWLRGMWRYAARCVLVAARNGDARRVQLGKLEPTAQEDVQQRRDADHERYKALYTRGLSDEGLRIIVFGRLLLPSASPRATDDRHKSGAQHGGATPLPVDEPLSLAEQWELSDLVERLAVKDQRVMRREVAQRVRRDYVSYRPIGPTGLASSTRALSIEIPDHPTADLASAETVRRASGASISPKHSSPNDPTAATSPMTSLPPDFVANHHHHTRSRAESSPFASPTKHNSHLSPPSPTSSVSSSHPHLTHSASAPVTRHKALGSTSPMGASKTTHFSSFRSSPSPTNLLRQQWFIESLLPSWLLLPSRVIPLINWHIGPVSVRLHHRTPAAADSAPLFPAVSAHPTPVAMTAGSSPSLIPPRLSDSFMEFHLEGLSGCALLCKTPSVSFLVELRLGLVRALLVDFASSFASPVGPSTGNSIRTDYIREPSDGFVYLGLKYNFKHATRVASLLAPVEEELWDVKAKLCVGTIHIEYNDMALQKAMKTDLTRRPSLASISGPFGPPSPASCPSPSSPIRLDSASYATIVHDVLSNWKTFIQRVQPPKPLRPQPSPVVVPTTAAPYSPNHTKQLKKEAAQARVTKLLNALMHQSSCVDIDANGIELQLSVLTSHVVERVRTVSKDKSLSTKMPLPLFDSEQVHITLPSTGAGLQNRPLLNECQVHAGGARVKFRTTKQGRAAVIDHVLHRLFPPPKSTPAATEGIV